MNVNDNSVNIKNEKPSYHHGDLRAALVAEGLKRLAASDAERLSLREIARNVGVSATAVYRHFPDKQRLLSALCHEGGLRLEQAMVESQAAAGGGVAGFNATGRAYVHFALSNPALFRLMMSDVRTRSWLDGSPEELMGLGLLRRNIAGLAAPGTSVEVQRVRAVQSWAIVHGLAMLILDGQVPCDEALIDAVVALHMHDHDAEHESGSQSKDRLS